MSDVFVNIIKFSGGQNSKIDFHKKKKNNNKNVMIVSK